MCDKAVRESLSSLEYVPDWFVTEGHVKLWHNGNNNCDDDDESDELIDWYEAYKKR